jgi:hypothetical protein
VEYKPILPYSGRLSLSAISVVPGEECARAGLVLTIQDIPVDMSQIEQLIAAFFWAHAIEAPGIQPSDLAQTLAAMLPK